MNTERPAHSADAGAASGNAAPSVRERQADAVRQIVTRRERAPRSPRMERALKRLIWRYTAGRAVETNTQDGTSRQNEGSDVQK